MLGLRTTGHCGTPTSLPQVTRKGPGGSPGPLDRREPADYFSIGAPTMLPYSVQEPS